MTDHQVQHALPRPDPYRTGLRRGLVGGAVILLVALVGMVEAFTKREIVAGVLDLGQVAWLGALVLVGVVAAREMRLRGEDRPPVQPALAAGGLAGAVAGGVIALFVVLGTQLDLGEVFDKARPALYAILSLGGMEVAELREASLGAAIVNAAWRPVVAGAALGAAGAGAALAPERWRRALAIAVTSMLVIGMIQDLLQKIDVVRRSAVLDGINELLYERSGLRPWGAATVLLASGALSLLWPTLRRVRQERTAAMASTQRAQMERWVRVAGLTLLGLLLLWFPFGFGRYPSDVIDLVGIYILMGLGLNIVVGFAGLLDLGYVAFFAIGAYAVGILTSAEPPSGVVIGWSFWQALPVAIALTILAGVILGIPVLKTHGDYLAIITLGFGEIIRILAGSDALGSIMGGAQGVTLIPEPLQIQEITVPFAGTMDPGVQQELYYPVLAGVAVAAYVSWRLRHSRFGRAWMAVREDEHVAAAMGINLVNAKLLAFATGAAFAGVAGALFASKLGSIFPSSFGLLVSINVLVLIIVGGMGSIPGVFVGALALVGLPELLREFDDFRMLLYGAVLVIMMLNRPEGLWPAAIVKRELGRGDGNEPPAALDEPVPERRDAAAAPEASPKPEAPGAEGTPGAAGGVDAGGGS